MGCAESGQRQSEVTHVLSSGKAGDISGCHGMLSARVCSVPRKCGSAEAGE